MLDDFKETQKIPYKILKRSLENKKLSHAYLIETNSFKEKEKFVLSFVKAVMCHNNYTNNKSCKNCFQCKNIEKKLFSEVKIIEPDGMWIKKEQLLELQKEFKTKSLNTKYKVYIINHAERLNKNAANSILKFLEEPEEGIIAILVTDNMHQLLDTIISRCQVITLSPDNNKNLSGISKLNTLLQYNFEESKLEEMVNNVIDFTYFLEKNKCDTIIYTKDLVMDKFKEKQELITFFEILILVYKDALNDKIGRDTDIFKTKDISHIVVNKNIVKLNEILQKIIELKKNVEVNANTNLLIDRLIIEIGGE